MAATTQIVLASECSLEDLTTAFNRGFEGYLIPHALTPQALEERIKYQDILLDGSFILQSEDGPVGLALLGVRGERAWCGELAVAPAYRTQGLGRRLMERLIEEVRARRLTQLCLEVLTQNTAAFQLYQSLGFRIVRELTSYAGPLAHAVAQRAFTGPLLLPGLSDEGDDGEELPVRPPVTLEATAVLAHYEALQLVQPSWEFERPVLERLAAAGRLSALVIPGEANEMPDAYLLTEVRESQVRLVGFGARPGADIAGGLELATALLSTLSQHYAGFTFRADEVPPGDPRGPVLDTAGCPVTYRFFEMALAF